MAARGSSTIVPAVLLIVSPIRFSTSALTSLIISMKYVSSLSLMMNGIIISTFGSLPVLRLTSMAASKIAEIYILEISGYTTPNLQPRKPIIGFYSLTLTIYSLIVSTGTPVSLLSSSTNGLFTGGKNSWRGGSNNLMLTGLPSIVSNKSLKSDFYNSFNSTKASLRCLSSTATIIFLIAFIFDFSKN